MKTVTQEKNHNTFVWFQVTGHQEWYCNTFVGKLVVHKSFVKGVGWLTFIGEEPFGVTPTRKEGQKFLETMARHKINNTIHSAKMRLETRLFA